MMWNIEISLRSSDLGEFVDKTGSKWSFGVFAGCNL